MTFAHITTGFHKGELNVITSSNKSTIIFNQKFVEIATYINKQEGMSTYFVQHPNTSNETVRVITPTTDTSDTVAILTQIHDADIVFTCEDGKVKLLKWRGDDHRTHVLSDDELNKIRWYILMATVI